MFKLVFCIVSYDRGKSCFCPSSRDNSTDGGGGDGDGDSGGGGGGGESLDNI